MRHTIQMIAIALMLPVIAGCALLQQEDSRLQLTVQYATLKLIEQSSDITGPIFVAHVERVRELVDEDANVTVARLADEVRAQVRWDRLDAADSMLLNALITEAELQITERIGDGILDEDGRIAIGVFCDGSSKRRA